ncbi:ion channel CASTOR-like [Gossypium australe]|uniref:Ion channel CASTOR-like n=1 Tax=Gossypium australe TaxID=47621 RepID=A0A5B6WEA9_9ROSI|nr:ion channel CASTOR-like [Gossypium australe]
MATLAGLPTVWLRDLSVLSYISVMGYTMFGEATESQFTLNMPKNLIASKIAVWTTGSLLKQLVITNESLGGGIVVVMAERDKEEMELNIAKMEFDFRGTSVICRSGSPLILADLKKVQFLSI